MILLAQGVSAGYDEADVLHDVDVQVTQGEFVGLVGPNGCGKSTLLRAMSRTLPVSSGKVTVDDVSIWAISPLDLARCIAFVPQQEPANFDFTVREVVLMGRYPHHAKRGGDTSRDYMLMRSALEDADIAALEDRPITRLSGGEHRRVLLARALAQDTRLILLDEPTAHLDVTHQAELLTLVKRLTSQRNVGALAALHDLNQAAEYCDRLVFMRAGRIIDSGPPEQVLNATNLREAYGAHASIGPNPVTGRPMILTIESLRGEAAAADGS